MILRWRLRTKLLIVSAFIFFMAALPLTILDYFQKVKLIDEHYDNIQELVVKNLSFDARESLQTGLFELFEDKCKFFIEERNISAVELRDADGITISLTPKGKVPSGVTDSLAIFSGSKNGVFSIENKMTGFDDQNGEQIGTLILYQYRGKYDEAVILLYQDTLLIFGLSLLVCFLGLFVVNYFIYSPLHKIFNGLYEIKKRNYSHKIELSKDDELGELARLINSTSQEIEKYNEEQESIIKLKNNVLQIAAHELRTPLLNIRTLIDIASCYVRDLKTDSALSSLNRCFVDLDLLDRRVTSTLSLSALENKSLAKNEKLVNLNKFFETLDNQFHLRSRSKSQVFWSCFASGPIESLVKMDEELVYIIVSNAIDNAMKYTNQGFVKVSFGIHNSTLCVTVHDSGVGMSKDEIERVNARSNDLHLDIRRKEGGWGIGMKTMFSFCEFLGGSINIDSKEGFGTKVNIKIPVICDFCSEHESSDAYLETPHFELGEHIKTIQTVSINSPKVNVLVIDNDEDQLNRMKILLSQDFLRRDDILATFCDDPEEAICMVEENEFDVIMVDYHMPKLDGLQFLRFVSEHSLTAKSTMKIVLTADANIPSEVKHEILSLADKLMSKGITSNDIKNIIRSISLRSVS